ncbi:MAG: bL21 family ribosomal protein, partial [Methylophilaceae bacterium]
RGDKVMIFKFRRRKHYRKTQGHRQSYTEILIDDVNGKGATAPSKVAAEKPVKASVAEKPAKAPAAKKVKAAE